MSNNVLKRTLLNRRIGKYVLIIAVLSLLASVPFIVGNLYTLHIIILATEYVVVAIGYDVMVGHLGMLSLCQPLFWGLAGYTTALLLMRTGLPWLLVFAISAIIPVIAAYAIGIPALRLSYHSFALVTLAFIITAKIVSTNWIGFTGGRTGIFGIPYPSILGFEIRGAPEFYWFILTVAILCFLLMYFVIHSRFGRTLHAIREDEVLAKTVGINCKKYRILGLMLSALFAGVAGSFHASLNTIITPMSFDMHFITMFLVMVIVGGSGNIWGVTLGAIIFGLAPELLRVVGQWREVIYGFIILLVLILFPEGIGGLLDRLSRLINKKLGKI